VVKIPSGMTLGDKIMRLSYTHPCSSVFDGLAIPQDCLPKAGNLYTLKIGLGNRIRRQGGDIFTFRRGSMINILKKGNFVVHPIL